MLDHLSRGREFPSGLLSLVGTVDVLIAGDLLGNGLVLISIEVVSSLPGAPESGTDALFCRILRASRDHRTPFRGDLFSSGVPGRLGSVWNAVFDQNRARLQNRADTKNAASSCVWLSKGISFLPSPPLPCFSAAGSSSVPLCLLLRESCKGHSHCLVWKYPRANGQGSNKKLSWLHLLSNLETFSGKIVLSGYWCHCYRPVTLFVRRSLILFFLFHKVESMCFFILAAYCDLRFVQLFLNQFLCCRTSQGLW